MASRWPRLRRVGPTDVAHTTVYEDAGLIRRLERALATPPLVLWTSTLAVHARREGHGPCPCCGCTTAHLTEERSLGDVLIETSSGERLTEAETDAQTWAALVADAHVVPMRVWSSERQAQIVDASARQVVIDGGAQSGKTEGAARAFALDIQRRGGRGRVFWLIAPSRRSAYIQAQKLALGYQGREPVIPAELVARGPRSHRDENLSIELIDGTLIDCRPADRADGSKVDGQECQGVWVDEVTKIRHPVYWREALNRTSATGGRVYGTSVPMQGHWFKEDIDAAEAHGDASLLAHFAISRYDNVRIPKADIDAQVAIMLAKPNGQLAVDAEIFGKWVNADGLRYFVEFDLKRHVVANSARNCDANVDATTGDKFVDVTAKASERVGRGRGWFASGLKAGNRRWIIGCDINLSPMCGIVCQIFARGQDLDEWGIAVVDEVSMDYATLPAFADRLATVHRGEYRGALVIADPQNCHLHPDILAGRKGNASAKAFSDAGFDVRPAAHTTREGKRIPVSPDLTDSHLLLRRMMEQDRIVVASTAGRLLDALERVVLSPGTNLPVKEPNTASDRLSNPIDGLRYLAWSIFGVRGEARARQPAPRAGPRVLGCR